MRVGIPTTLALLGSLAAVILVTGAGSLRAQVLPRHLQPAGVPAVQRATLDSTSLAEDITRSAVGAALGGVVGFYTLGLAGFYLAGGGDICGDDACGFAGGLLGAVLGEAIGIGLGAHVVNRGRGDALSAIGASLGVLLLSGMVAQYVDLGEDAVYLVPILQVAGAVWAEVATARRKRSPQRS
jgi:hypothetical protein